MIFTVYFEFFGRRMKTDVEAKNEAEARLKVSRRINFIRVEPSDGDPGIINFLKDIMNGNK